MRLSVSNKYPQVYRPAQLLCTCLLPNTVGMLKLETERGNF